MFRPPAGRGGRQTTDTDWLALGLAQRQLNQSLAPLLRAFDGPAGLRVADAAALHAAGLSAKQIRSIKEPAAGELRRAERWLAESGHFAVTWADDAFPALLRSIADPPVVLFGRGNPEAAGLPQLAIVGSRNATPAGRQTAWQFARELGAAGFAITSGLARGIDTNAHRGALATNALTVAICGTGPDIVYPAANRRLADQIAERGAILTEFAPGTGPRRAHFPRRNRLISGLAAGVLVVEAGERSGALITARLAANQGREVFAVPGSIREPLARGCHRLLRDGATLVEEPAEIVNEIGSLLGCFAQGVEQNPAGQAPDPPPDLDSAAKYVLERMGWAPVSIDELVYWTGLTAAELCSMLLTLELAGCVIPLAGGRFQRREDRAR